MKLNWGFGIALFYITFMVVMLYFVFKSTTYDNSLVVDNYYEQDLKYQKQYDKIINTQKLEEQVTIQYNSSARQVELSFPATMKESVGIVQLYCPSAKTKDVFKALKLDQNGQMVIKTNNLSTGRWKVKIDWQHGELPYYNETEIIL